MPPGIASIKLQKRNIVAQYARPENLRGLVQAGNTLLPLAGLWGLIAWSAGGPSGWVLIPLAMLAMCLLLLRVFVLMHECGHGSLFRSPALNQGFGFLFGVISGMPQYVWSQHHNYHHATNGNWAKYRGPLAILTDEEFDRLSPAAQRAYVRDRRIVMAPLAGFLYLLVNPRRTWIKGSLQLLAHIIRGKWAEPQRSLREHAASFRTGFWATRAEYWHMSLNNLALFAAWGLMVAWMGPLLFLPVYILSTALSGGAGIVLFTVQHNFEHSYASGDAQWCYDTAAIHGTSYLELPGWLNWCTASIGYHHIHHLSARIPNYHLARCHREHAALFSGVRRLRLGDVVPALRYLLWDPGSRRIISVAEHEASKLAAAA